MGCFPSRICGRDADEIFAYPTPKFVRIRDRRLGLVKYFLTLAIVLYVSLFSLAYEGLYLEASPVAGGCRFTLQQPTRAGCDPFAPSCANAFAAVDTEAYCEQSDRSYAGNKLRCRFEDAVEAAVIQASSILVTTRVTTTVQRKVCNATAARTCPFLFNDTAPEEKTYVADVGRFTVLVDHSVLAVALPALRTSSSKAKGRLFVRSESRLCGAFPATSDPRGHHATKRAPCYVEPNVTDQGLDFFALDVLLAADGASLDDVRDGGKTLRETGAALLLSIEYDNFRPWHGVGEIFYTYTPMLVKHSTYKRVAAVYDDYPVQRTLLDHHGIFIEATQAGTLRGWSFNNLLIQLTTSLTLFVTATVLTDFLALYVLPDAVLYASYKYENTPAITDRRQRSRRRFDGFVDDDSEDDHGPTTALDDALLGGGDDSLRRPPFEQRSSPPLTPPPPSRPPPPRSSRSSATTPIPVV